MDFMMYAPTRVLFGYGKLNELSKHMIGRKKALLVISNGKSARENGYLNRCIDQLTLAGVSHAVFDKIEPNPLKGTVMAGAAAARANGCDCVVALGGGSVMDASKAIAAMATNEGDLWEYISGGTGGGKPLTNDALPLIAITTTAGTGSEVDGWGVVTNDATHEKIGFGGHDSLYPVLAIVDPELMLTVPPLYTALQGFDALFHSTETYINRHANPMSDMVARTAIEQISRNLARAVKDGQDREARTAVAFGNTVSGYSMETGGCTSEHSLEHAMSAYHQALPHGAGLIMISLAYYEHFIDRHVCDERFVDMAKFMGMENAKEAKDFLTALKKLQSDCGVAELKMSDYGLERTEFETLARNAKSAMGGLFTCDRCELSISDCVAIYEKSYR